MYNENVGSPVLLIDTIGKFYSNCGSRDCIRSLTINETHNLQVVCKMFTGNYGYIRFISHFISRFLMLIVSYSVDPLSSRY